MKKVFYILMFVPLLVLSQNSWNLSKNDQGIKVWTRAVKDTPYKEYKAITRVKTTIQKVVDELLDAPLYMKDCEAGVSHFVKVTEQNEYIFYVRNNFPWPIKDRDVVSRLSIQKVAPNKVKLLINAAPGETPKLKNTLRIQELLGHWLVEAVDGEVQITQQLYVNPEGTLPPFITNSLLVIGPFRTFLTLRNRLHNVNS